MRTRRRLPGLRLLIAAGALAMLGLGAGAAVPDSASATGSSGGDTHLCSGTKTLDPAPDDGVVVQTCTITASTGVCIQRSSAPVVIQECSFLQNDPSQDKRATAIQTHDPEGFDGLQDGEQEIMVVQRNTTRRNLLDAVQIADQCLGAGDRYEGSSGDRYDRDRDGDRDDDGRCEDEEEDDNDGEERSEDVSGPPLLNPVGQHQEAHQSIDGDQSAGGSGRNEAKAFQSQHLHQRAAKAPATRQRQNTDERASACDIELLDEDINNACYTIKQSAQNGANISLLGQVYNLFQSARDIGAGVQQQGAPEDFFGGLEHGFRQTNTATAPRGTPLQAAKQAERMTQRRDDTTAIAWYQHGPLRKGILSVQIGGSATAKALDAQDSVLRSTGGGSGEQTDFLSLGCTSSSGNCTGFQHAKLTDDQRTVERTNGPFTAPSLFMTINCGNVYPPDYYGTPPPEECVATGPEPVPFPD